MTGYILLFASLFFGHLLHAYSNGDRAEPSGGCLPSTANYDCKRFFSLSSDQFDLEMKKNGSICEVLLEWDGIEAVKEDGTESNPLLIENQSHLACLELQLVWINPKEVHQNGFAASPRDDVDTVLVLKLEGKEISRKTCPKADESEEGTAKTQSPKLTASPSSPPPDGGIDPIPSQPSANPSLEINVPKASINPDIHSPQPPLPDHDADVFQRGPPTTNDGSKTATETPSSADNPANTVLFPDPDAEITLMKSSRTPSPSAVPSPSLPPLEWWYRPYSISALSKS